VATIDRERMQSLVGQLDELTASVGGIRQAPDQALALEIGDRLGHRLRPHALGHGQIADRHRPFTVEAPEHGALGEREAMLGAQPANQAAEHQAQLAREQPRVDGRPHGNIFAEVQGNCSGFLSFLY
jgi:hypothetical protein